MEEAPAAERIGFGEQRNYVKCFCGPGAFAWLFPVALSRFPSAKSLRGRETAEARSLAAAVLLLWSNGCSNSQNHARKQVVTMTGESACPTRSSVYLQNVETLVPGEPLHDSQNPVDVLGLSCNVTLYKSLQAFVNSPQSVAAISSFHSAGFLRMNSCIRRMHSGWSASSILTPRD
jgi:hypothetical protein